MEFDSEAWAAERGNMDGESARATMVPQLEAAGVKPGASRDAVRALLGEPDAFSDAQDSYYLGRAGFGIDLETLVIEYDANGVVTQTGIQRS